MAAYTPSDKAAATAPSANTEDFPTYLTETLPSAPDQPAEVRLEAEHLAPSAPDRPTEARLDTGRFSPSESVTSAELVALQKGLVVEQVGDL